MKRMIGLGLFVLALLLFVSGQDRKDTAELHANKVEAIQFNIDSTKPMVALTYDDGPHQEVTAEILDILEQYQAHATFFLVGDRISHHTEIIQRMIALGCELGNHSYGHLDLSKISVNEISQQLQSSEDALASFIDKNYLPQLVRPPFGNTNETLLKHCPYPIIVWSIDTKDWSHQNAQKTIQEVMENVQDGDIILMHDLYKATAEATEVLVKQLMEQGYQLLTVSEMFEAKQIELQAGKVYHHAR